MLQDISLGVALGSATQISLFVVSNEIIFDEMFMFDVTRNLKTILMGVFSQVPLSVIVAWTMGIKMDLNFNILETSCLALAIIITAFTLQVNISPYTYNQIYIMITI